MFFVVRDYSSSKLKDNEQKPYRKVTKLKSKFSLTLSWLNQALSNLALKLERGNARIMFRVQGNNVLDQDSTPGPLLPGYNVSHKLDKACEIFTRSESTR